MVICNGRFECAKLRECVHKVPHKPSECYDGKMCNNFRSFCGQINRVVRCTELANNECLVEAVEEHRLPIKRRFCG
jgi:hypothetical protein